MTTTSEPGSSGNYILHTEDAHYLFVVPTAG